MLGQRVLDLGILVDGPLLGKIVSKTVSQIYAFDQSGEWALILMSLLIQAEIFTGDFMVLWHSPLKVAHPLGYVYLYYRRSYEWVANERNQKTLY